MFFIKFQGGFEIPILTYEDDYNNKLDEKEVNLSNEELEEIECIKLERHLNIGPKVDVLVA